MSSTSSSEKDKELGKAIARGILEENAQKERNMQKAQKRKETMLKNAAESIFKDYA